jgi:GTPase SAR1 family protein
MVKEISKLIEIAQELQLEDNAQQLSEIQKRMQQTDTELVIPFVGEFSSGKTSIINALTDNLLDVKIVQVFDTSEKIPASMVLTDTNLIGNSLLTN